MYSRMDLGMRLDTSHSYTSVEKPVKLFPIKYYDVIAFIESGDGCEHEELNLDALNSHGQPICAGAVVKRRSRHYPKGPCASHDEL